MLSVKQESREYKSTKAVFVVFIMTLMGIESWPSDCKADAIISTVSTPSHRFALVMRPIYCVFVNGSKIAALICCNQHLPIRVVVFVVWIVDEPLCTSCLFSKEVERNSLICFIIKWLVIIYDIINAVGCPTF